MTSNGDAKFNHLRKQAEQQPDNPHFAKDLVAHLVAEGQQTQAIRTLHKAFERLEGLLLPEQLHKPVMTTMLDQGMLEPVEMVVCDLEQRYDVDDDITIKRLVRKGRREIRKRFGLFTDNIKGEDWWRNGPHVLKGEYEEWLPGTVSTIQEDVISIQVWGHTDYNSLDSYMVQLTKQNIDGKVKEGTSIEIGISDGGRVDARPYS